MDNSLCCETRSIPKSDAASQLSALLEILEEHLSQWEGWENFNNCFNKILHNQVLRSSQDIEVIPLAQYQLQGFIDLILSKPWQYSKNPLNIFFVPKSTIELFQNVSEANQKQKEDARKRHEDEFNEKLQTLEQKVNEMNELMEKEMMTTPDYRHPIVVKSYDNNGMSQPYVAPKNGYIICTYCSDEAWVYLKINGERIPFGQNAGIGWQRSANLPFIFPIRKDDSFLLEGGRQHSAIFYPCLKG